MDTALAIFFAACAASGHVEQPGRTWPTLPDRVQLSPDNTRYAPTGTVIRQNEWMAVVRLDQNGQEHAFAKRVVCPLPPEN
jgi:hypothetical protein